MLGDNSVFLKKKTLKIKLLTKLDLIISVNLINNMVKQKGQ
jgi:hypothetical protein